MAVDKSIDSVVVVDWSEMRRALENEFSVNTEFGVRVLEGQTPREGLLIVSFENKKVWFSLTYNQGEVTVVEKRSKDEQTCSFMFEIVEFVDTFFE